MLASLKTFLQSCLEVQRGGYSEFLSSDAAFLLNWLACQELEDFLPALEALLNEAFQIKYPVNFASYSRKITIICYHTADIKRNS